LAEDERLIPRATRDVHPLIWLGLPALGLAMRLLTPLLGFERWTPVMDSELGFVENATVAMLVPAFVLCVLVFLRRRALPTGIGWWMLAYGLAALYFAGEEVSWGQWWFGYATPEAVARLNEQQEFNLHNIHNLFNNLPRQAMNGSMVAAIVLPLVLYRPLRKPGKQHSLWQWLIPTWRVIPAAALSLLIRAPKRLIEWLDPRYDPEGYVQMAFVRASGEIKEYFLAAAMLVYTTSIFVRMRAARPCPKEAGSD